MSTTKLLVKPSNVIHRLVQNTERVCVWLTNDNHSQIQGTIIGYDEFMNLVIDNAVEVELKTNASTPLGRILLKGENVALIHVLGI